MTVLQFRARRPGSDGGGSARRGEPPVAPGVAVPVTGWFRSPIGGRGRFVGSFRLEDRPEGVPATAVGVFAGTLRDAEDKVIGIAARRQSTAATLSRDGGVPVMVLHPVSVDLLGFQVRLGPVVIVLSEDAAGVGPGAERVDRRGRLPGPGLTRTRMHP